MRTETNTEKVREAMRAIHLKSLNLFEHYLHALTVEELLDRAGNHEGFYLTCETCEQEIVFETTDEELN